MTVDWFRIVRAVLVLFCALVLQGAFVSRVGVLGAHGDVLLLVPITAGLTAGAERGAVAGFAAGLAVDCLVQTPFGLTALAYCLTGYGVGALQAGVLRSSWWLPVVSALAGSAAGVVLFAAIGRVLGLEGVLDGRLWRVVVAVALVNVALVAPSVRLARFVEGPDRRTRLAVR